MIIFRNIPVTLQSLSGLGITLTRAKIPYTKSNRRNYAGVDAVTERD